MKYLYLILIFICWGCRAQSPILSLSQSAYDSDIDGAYYKDLNNQLNIFAGTWKYTNGNTTLIITLEKKLMQEVTDPPYHFFEDIIVGEYKYVENGVEKINTLPQMTTNNTYSHGIVGNILFGQGNKYLRTGFIDPDRDIPGMEPAMFFERVDSNGIQKLKLLFRPTASAISFDGQPLQYTSFTVPFGEYILVKQ